MATRPSDSPRQHKLGLRAIPDPCSISDPAKLARLIGKYRKKIRIAYRTGLEHAVTVGKLLLRAKELLPHGEYTTWVRENCPGISKRTASDYKRLAEEWPVLEPLIDSKRQRTADLTIAGALKLLAKERPADEDQKPSEAATQSRETDADLDEESTDPDEESTDDEQDADGSDHDEDERPETRRNRSEAASTERETGQADQERSEAEAAKDGLDHEAEEAAEVIEMDPAWLASFPIRAQLSDPSIFDEQASLWRLLEPLMDQLRDIFEPSTDEFDRAWLKTFYKMRYSYLVAVLLGVNPPQDWLRCPRCTGSGKNSELKIVCAACWGAGFVITHCGDPVAHEPEDSKPVIKTN